jgi:hypothetical protein
MGFFQFWEFNHDIVIVKIGFINKKLSDILLEGRIFCHLSIASAHSHLNHCIP